MNPSKAWNAKLEAGFFWPSKNLYKQCDLEMLAFPKSGNSIPANSDQAVLLHTYSIRRDVATFKIALELC